MYLGFRPHPSELPLLPKRSAPRFVLVWLKQESRVGKIHNWHKFTYSLRLKSLWITDEKRTEKSTRSLDKTKICPVTTPCFYKDRIHFRKFLRSSIFPLWSRLLTRSEPRKVRGLSTKQRFVPSQPLASTKIESIFANFWDLQYFLCDLG